MTVLIIVLVLAFAVGRAFIKPRLTNIPSPEMSYEAFAHLFVGFLILVRYYDPQQTLGPTHLYSWLGWGLSLWELGWFLAQKYL
jgi:hypothetical protein